MTKTFSKKTTPSPKNLSFPTGATDPLVKEILKITKSQESVNFYQKAIVALGEGIVNEELGELRYRMKTSQVEDPARYFTRLLQNQLENQNLKFSSRTPKKTHFSSTPETLFGELSPRKATAGQGTSHKEMEIPYSKQTIPWATFLGPEFFTLSTNRNKSDRVLARFRTLDGQITMVPLVRGRIKPRAEARGLLTVEHARILGALEVFWTQQDCPYIRYENSAVACYCTVPIREMARLMGRKSFGGRDLLELYDYILDLKSRPYYLELESMEGFVPPGLKGLGFTLIGDVTVLDKKETLRGRPKNVVRVLFSDTYSRQLLARRAVSRPKEMLKSRMEMTFLVRLYLEPILLGKDGPYEHSIELKHLIEILNLPVADWHKYKSTRKRELAKVAKELNGKKAANGKKFNLSIQKGLNPDDFLLGAYLA